MARRVDSGERYETFCGCALVFAGQIWHRVLINKEPPVRVARDLGIRVRALLGIQRILEHCGRVPSLERLALVSRRPPDITDDDVAEWFHKPLWWGHEVMDREAELRAEEPIPDELEWFDGGMDVPSPEQIRSACLAIRAKEDRARAPRWTPPQLQWNGVQFEVVS